jgi:hypothetical protein
MTEKEKFIEICNLTTNVVGLEKNSLSEKTRKEKIHTPRMVASMVGRIVEDIHPVTIAKIIKRDRTSVLHYEKCHNMYYTSDPKYRELFNKIYNIYFEIIKLKKKFESEEKLRMLLVKSGIDVNIKNAKVFIIIKSGKVVYKLKSNYFDFTENINIIKEALKDYRYTIEIKMK